MEQGEGEKVEIQGGDLERLEEEIRMVASMYTQWFGSCGVSSQELPLEVAEVKPAVLEMTPGVKREIEGFWRKEVLPEMGRYLDADESPWAEWVENLHGYEWVSKEEEEEVIEGFQKWKACKPVGDGFRKGILLQKEKSSA
eukprot:TRINITY_DN42972_c0_g1_i1.p1 TRINITY_DN42972_c0_g1~~TRINITY_DN42972_c0_g1_i1.p1  ORF type:complete len:151 (-),score=24.28 TRINITY_DN42972_c0_g1_i1:58-480(-)